MSREIRSTQLVLCLVVAMVSHVCEVFGDIYMHNPRGSNDRNCERTVNRQNGNRLFNSQNNNNGGYACPRGVGNEDFQAENGDAVFNSVDPSTGATTTFTQNKRIYYYEGSILPIEWTQQHGCGSNGMVKCEIVLQYACEDTLDPRVDNFWPWSAGKGDSGTTYFGKQHFRNGGDHIAAPRDGVPRDSDDAATQTIPDNEASALPTDIETRRFGMHENYDYYQLCQRTERNKGLYTADQLVRRVDRRGTRQNPNGNRHGFECPEERDYYPYWAPSPWIDIAVLTDEAQNDRICYPETPQGTCSKRCQYYMNNTMNFNTKGYCDPNHSSGTSAQKTNSPEWNARKWYNNKAACIAAGFNWYEISHKDILTLNATNNFVCAHTQFSRVNQLGNADGDTVISQNELNGSLVVNTKIAEGLNANRFMWKVPDIPTPTASDASDYFPNGDMESAYKSCVLRIRYNISTGDFQQWPEDAVNRTLGDMVDSRNNSAYEGDPKTPLQQDPYIYVGPGDLEEKGDKFLSLAINTNQYGRTFQDRSYAFTIKKLPTASSTSSTQLDTPEVDWTTMEANLRAGGRIYNVNVRGKRGNIVQTFPSVEYDFVPNSLALGKKDMIHFQWTGSDYNPRRGCNNGEGGPPDANAYSTDANAANNPRADRSNIVFTETLSSNTPRDYTGYDQETTTLGYDDKVTTSKDTIMANVPCYDSSVDDDATKTQCYNVVNRLMFLNQQLDGGALVLRTGKGCLTVDDLNTIAQTNRDVAEHHPLNCAKLNAKPYPYYDAGIMFLKKSGLFSYFSSRNNNFSNRAQIGLVCVGSMCKIDDAGRVTWSGTEPVAGSAGRQTSATCIDKSMGGNGESNANGASSCIGDVTDIDGAALVDETEAVNESDNDNKGEGNPRGCAQQSNYGDTFITNTGLSKEEQIAISIGLIAGTILISWIVFMIFRRYNPRRKEETEWLRRSQFDRNEASYEQASHFDKDWTSGRDVGPDWDQGGEEYMRNTGAAPAAGMPSQKKSQRPVSAVPNTADLFSANRESSFRRENPMRAGGSRSPPPPPPSQAHSSRARQNQNNRADYL